MHSDTYALTQALPLNLPVTKSLSDEGVIRTNLKQTLNMERGDSRGDLFLSIVDNSIPNTEAFPEQGHKVGED